MAYVVRDSNNNIVATVADNTVDTSTTIQLIGKNYVGYGTALNQNLVRMMEHFAKTTSPSNPITGQVWYDTNTNDLKVYNGSSFVQAIKTVANLAAGNVTATGNVSATNINGNQLVSTVADGTPPLIVTSGSRIPNLNASFSGNVVNGNSNITVNPNSYVTVSVAGTSDIVNVATTGVTITGNANITNTVNASVGNLTTINSGLVQNGNSNVTITANSSVSIAANGAVRTTIDANGNMGIGTATPSSYSGKLVVTSTNATQIFRVDESTSGYSYTQGLDDTSVYYKTNSASRGYRWITNTSTEVMRIKQDGNVGIGNSAPTHTLSVTGTMNISGNANVGNLGTSTIIATTANLTTINSGVLQNGNSNVSITANGNVTLNVTSANSYTFATSSFAPNANATQQLGLTTNRWSNVWGVSSSALYADLAEKYRSDYDYEPGTVLELGGEHEITVCNTPNSNKVFGCVSTDPAYLMNDTNKDGIWLPVVLVGRAPIRVAGPVNKGDRLVSAGNGAAMAAGVFGSSYQTEIGRALENKDTTDVGLIQAYINTK